MVRVIEFYIWGYDQYGVKVRVRLGLGLEQPTSAPFLSLG